jgi:hypothetical protein
VAKRSRVFELDVGPTVASLAIREAIRGAGWEYAELSDHVEARESLDRLSCKESPVKVGIRLHQDDAERVEIQLDGWVAGWGPIASRLPDRLRMLERTIRERCSSVS